MVVLGFSICFLSHSASVNVNITSGKMQKNLNNIEIIFPPILHTLVFIHRIYNICYMYITSFMVDFLLFLFYKNERIVLTQHDIYSHIYHSQQYYFQEI